MQKVYKCDSHDLNTAFNVNVGDYGECVLRVNSRRGYMI